MKVYTMTIQKRVSVFVAQCSFLTALLTHSLLLSVFFSLLIGSSWCSFSLAFNADSRLTLEIHDHSVCFCSTLLRIMPSYEKARKCVLCKFYEFAFWMHFEIWLNIFKKSHFIEGKHKKYKVGIKFQIQALRACLKSIVNK